MRWRKQQRHPNSSVQAILDDPKFRCFGCCHVQTGTICLGVYNLITQMVCFGVLTFAILNPHLLLKHGSESSESKLIGELETPNALKDGSIFGEKTPLEKLERLPTPLPLRAETGVALPRSDMKTEESELGVRMPIEPVEHNEMPPNGLRMYAKSDVLVFTHRRVQSGDAHLALALVFGLMVITMMLVYGTVKCRPVYLLPFFCFQVFDFILSCLTAVGHYTYLPNARDMIANNPHVPFHAELMRVNSQWVALSIMLAYMLVLFVKSYLIGVVWACYQFLHVRMAAVTVYAADDQEELLLPPDYEAATKMAHAEYIPPPQFNQPPPYEA